METASASRSNGAGSILERDLYNFVSAREMGSVETDINPGRKQLSRFPQQGLRAQLAQ